MFQTILYAEEVTRKMELMKFRVEFTMQMSRWRYKSKGVFQKAKSVIVSARVHQSLPLYFLIQALIPLSSSLKSLMLLTDLVVKLSWPEPFGEQIWTEADVMLFIVSSTFSVNVHRFPEESSMLAYWALT